MPLKVKNQNGNVNVSNYILCPDTIMFLFGYIYDKKLQNDR